MSAGRTLLSRAQDLLPYLLVAFLYCATSPYHRGLNNPNEMVRLYMSAAWVEHGDFVIQPEIRRWGMVDDKAIRDGELYSSKAPLQSLLGIPAYAASTPVLEALGAKLDKRHRLYVVRLLGSVIFGIAFAAILIAWARRRAVELGAPRALGTALGLVGALGTMLYPYTITFTGHLIAAFAAGGCYLALVGLSRAPPGSARWRWMAILAGFAGGAAPFAEYPSALVAAPALVAGFWMQASWRDRGRLFGWLAVGGAAPFALGLWAHQALWGSPLKTGYTFLENKGYVEVHGEGFFGVSYPKAEALGGSLFSPGTGLFFFSPILLVGLAMLVWRLWPTRPPAVGATVATAAAAAGEAPPAAELPEPVAADEGLPRPLAWAAVLGFVFSVYFIASHKGWRGGWTVGPRYIIAVAPVLWIWVVEALARPRIRSLVAAFGMLSILLTGFAAALYPHLSDVYTNPLVTFLLPSYAHGEMTYGLAYWAGLSGQAANSVHVVPLALAMAYVAFAGEATLRRLGVVAAATGLTLGLAFAVPEEDPGAARRENRRLWGFWEPATPGDGPKGARRKDRPGRVYRARDRWRQVTVQNLVPGRPPRACKPSGPNQCRYGDHPWQRFGPDTLTMDGSRERILFMHPIKDATVQATLPVDRRAAQGVLRYGLADASVTSDNEAPVDLVLRQGSTELARVQATNDFGLFAAEFTVTSTQPLTLEVTAAQDGARVLGWDLELYRAAPDDE